MMTYKALRPEFPEQQPCSCCSVAKLCPNLCSDWSLLKFMSIELVMQSNHLILCHPILLLPSIFPYIRVFSSELTLHIRQPKYWSFSFSICPSNACSGWVCFRIDWFDLLAIQGTLKNLLKHHNSKSINYLKLNLHYGPTLTTVHDYWKNHSFDYRDLFWQSDVSVF